MTLISIFITLQIILFFFMILHDWLHVPPLTDVRALEKHHTKKERLVTSAINGALVLIPLLLTWHYGLGASYGVRIIIAIIYGLLTVGSIWAWWVPYLFGSSTAHKIGFAEYRHTHHFLPKRGDRVVPNTFHVILHLQIWACFGISLYLLSQLPLTYEGLFWKILFWLP